ncbi:hypothetical protein [Clostridium sp. C8-1-8]|uniref:hypothetical protein n=1 Tax=Clostridium sp. C8-1-8 TaxID=2698831 RepID=UPI00136BF2E7|nr:hypothetical protein [Clostridium sp. C8-1-8]
MKKVFGTLFSAVLLASFCSVPAFATSNSQSVSAFNGKLTSNVWIQSIADVNGTGDFQVSAHYSGTNPYNADWIKTSWNFYSIGGSVSWNGAGISGDGTSTGSSWTNYNSSDASFRGRVAGNGLCLYVGCNNTATMFARGVTYSTLAKV